MIWEKQRRIFVPDGAVPWMRTHAALPVADLMNETTLRIYFAGRDDDGRSRIGWIDVDSDDPASILRIGSQPLLPLGERGTFDDSGMTPSCIVSDVHRKYFYYIGWNPQVTVSYRLAIGLAISEDGGQTFWRHSTGPLLDRDQNEPFFNTAPCVLRESNRWRMWYVSCTGWHEVNGHPEPEYHVKYAESTDGLSWQRTGIVCVDYDATIQAIGRPWVVYQGDRYVMWFSYRGLDQYRTNRETSYRIGQAESFDGIHWKRSDDPPGLERSDDGWDSSMVAYTNVVQIHGRQYCFYNGNGFGRSGIGYAAGRTDETCNTRSVA